MNCEQFIEQTCIDPADSAPELQAHARECVSCAAYAERARAAEALIHEALRFDTRRFAAQPVQLAGWSTFAAAVILGFALWFATAVERPAPTGELITEVLQHWDHEPTALRSGATAIAQSMLDEVLAGEVTIDLAALELAAIGPVTYANKCIVAGQWMSHLVVQSDAGPVTILLIPQQTVDTILPLELAAQSLGGGIFPAGDGAVAVFSAGGAANAPMLRSIVATVDIST